MRLPFWSRLSIAKKLYLVIGTMAVLIACELGTLRFAMGTLSSVRAFVGGEGTWSKAQKDAAISLQRYALSRDEADYREFLAQLRIPEGDHEARVELMKPVFDRELVRRDFYQGGIHPADIDGTIDLLRNFYRVSYLARAIAVWTQGDELLASFRDAGVRYHEMLIAHPDDRVTLGELRAQIRELNAKLTRLEIEFSDVLGQGSRWLEYWVISLLCMLVLTVEAFGLSLTFRTTRALSRGLAEANDAAARIGAGNFDVQLPVRSDDELGTLARSINRMGALLRQSYGELEARVASRTAELERMARENARLYEQASAAVLMRDEFFSIASHELKTPLTGMILQLQMLVKRLEEAKEGGSVPPKLVDSGMTCLRQGRRLAQLADELMDLTRIRAGRLEIKPVQGDLAAVVRDAAAALGPEAARSGSRLDIRVEGPIEGTFDPSRLGQVVTNLVSNAVKYGNAKPVEINARREGALGVVEVRDQGVGIAPEDHERVFQRFERASETEAKVSGLGLGLYISRQLIERHGGRILLRSQVGEGSEFRVEVPLETA